MEYERFARLRKVRRYLNTRIDSDNKNGISSLGTAVARFAIYCIDEDLKDMEKSDSYGV